MTDHASSSLGCCPRCDARIPRECMLIEYERGDEEYPCFAACPTCEGVIRPR